MQAITAHLVADYLNIGTADNPDIQVISVAPQLSENPKMKVKTVHYTANKSATEIPVGFATEFSFEVDLYKDEKIGAFLRDVAEEQKMGVVCDYYSVRLYQPAAAKPNTYYARKFSVTPVLSSIKRQGGEIVSVQGSLKPLGDVTVGEFNIVTKAFTPAEGA